MKKTTIEIEVRDYHQDAVRRTIEAYAVYPFAVHVAVEDADKSTSHRRRWAVTHIPSGLAVRTDWTFEQAMNLARALASQRFWLAADPRKWTPGDRAEAKALRDQVFADLGL